MHGTHMMLQPPMLAHQGTLIVGGGPAGMALLLAASREAGLEDLLRHGLAVVERGTQLGCGALGKYAITSDSTADTFLTSVRDHRLASLAHLEERPESKAIAAHGGKSGVKLTAVGDFLAMLGTELGHIVEQGGGRMFTGYDAVFASRTGTGWMTRLRRLADGALFDLPSSNLVIATGGAQSVNRLGSTLLAGITLGERCGDRLIGSDEVLSLGGLQRVAKRLRRRGGTQPRIVIVGGSTSAVTTANLILNSPLGRRLGPTGLSILHRRELRPFYPSRDAAIADGYTDFGPDDICPLSGFVYRLAGFRTEARDLVLAALGIGGRVPDPRLHLQRLGTAGDAAASDLLDRADIVIAALGYRPRAMALHDEYGVPMTLSSDGERPGPMVDGLCRVLDAERRPIRGLYGIGLAAGFVPSGALGGEPSFTGQANGLWLWQNAVGAMIASQICETLAAESALELEPTADALMSASPSTLRPSTVMQISVSA